MKNNISIKIILLVVALIFAYSEALHALISTWIDRDDYSHGFLIPIISFYMIWSEKNNLKLIQIKPNIVTGSLLLLTSSLIFIAGNISGVVLIQGLSFIITISALILLFLGIKHLKHLSLPISYLLLMVPIFDIVTDKLHWPFQILAAITSAFVIGLFNIPILRNVQYLELPNITLEVAPECSGINYLISIIAISIPLACFTLKAWWQRIIFLLIAIVIGIIVNWLRIILIAFWSYYTGSHIIHGPFHIFQGVFVSLLGFMLLFIGTIVLNKFFFSKTK